MTKNRMLSIRISREERRALNRYAKLRGLAVSKLIRSQIIEPALREDPRQRQLPLGTDHHAPAA